MADFRGNLVLLYFGYTFCPDVCPTDLWRIGAAIHSLGNGGETVQLLFVTLDPERDRPELPAQYLPNFHPRFVGLTGTEREIAEVAERYKVYFDKVRTESTCLVDHSANIYLLGQSGEYLGALPPGTSAERLAGVIAAALAGT